MDNNKIFDLSQVNPVVYIANYFHLKASVKSWGPRMLVDFELILIREGIYQYEERALPPIILHPGDMLIIPPFKKQKLFLIDDNKKKPAIACIHNHPLPIDGNWGYGGDSLFLFHRKTTLSEEDFSLMNDLFRRTARLFGETRPYRDELLSTLCRQIWLTAGAYWKEAPPLSAPGKRMEEMLRFIRDNYHRKLTRNDLAREFSLTPEYVNALCKGEWGMTPSEVINREKIHRGYTMLHNEGMSVKETAFRCGFTDEYYFARVFKAILGISPGSVKGGR